MDCAFGSVPKKLSLYPRSSGFSSLLSSKSFLVFCFIFRPMIHFELIFVKGVRSVSRLICVCVYVLLF